MLCGFTTKGLMKSKIITCLSCNKISEYIVKVKQTCLPKYCIPCANKRRSDQINESNDMWSEFEKLKNKVKGRPRNDRHDKTFGKDDCRMGWDEPNFGGY